MTSTSTFVDIPELYETDLGEMITSRTLSLNQIKDVGPPDLCYIVKSSVKPSINDVSSYHFVLGVDASSSATLAAYINSLTYLFSNEDGGWFNSKTNSWRLKSGVYCCYNAFSKVDVRVEVKIPGSVECYLINTSNEKFIVSEEMWTETFVSSCLRSLHYSEDFDYNLKALRRLSLINNPQIEMKFFEGCIQVYKKACDLGAPNNVQLSTLTNNFLSNAIKTYLKTTQRYDKGVDLFHELSKDHNECNSLLAKYLLKSNKQIKAFKTLYEGLKKEPTNYQLLLCQCSIVSKKKDYEIAFKLANLAIECQPSEFNTWYKYSKLLIKAKHYKKALLTINSCPMFTFTQKEVPRVPPPSRFHYPMKSDDILGYGIQESDENINNEDNNQSPLNKLPANNLKGTFLKAYKLLTLIVHDVGWDELLKIRSNAFVMEEEYKSHSYTNTTTKENDSTNKNNNTDEKDYDSKTNKQETKTNKSSDSIIKKSESEQGIKENSSNNSKSIKSSKSEEPKASSIISLEEEKNKIKNKKSDSNKSNNENDSNSKNQSISHKENEETDNDEGILENSGSLEHNNSKIEKDEVKDRFENISLEYEQETKIKENGIKEKAIKDTEEDEKESTKEDERTSTKENEIEEEKLVNENEEHESNGSQKSVKSENVQKGTLHSEHNETINNRDDIQHKRLCERWLDNLFMVLYDDLRAFTHWRTETNSARSQRLTYRYTGNEWEALGNLCMRLHKKEDARDAYTNCVHQKFSYKAWCYLLIDHTSKNELELAIGALIRVALHDETKYSECIIPSITYMCLTKLINIHGLQKINNMIVALNLPHNVDKIITRYFETIRVFENENNNT